MSQSTNHSENGAGNPAAKAGAAQETAKAPAIAVVGVSALFPGSLDATGFWHDILAAKDLMSDVPPDHWLVEDYYGEPGTPDKIYTKRGAFLNDVDFDPMHWGMPPGNISSTDTAQLLALIVAQKVLEDASGSAEFEGIDRDRVSVILGVASATELVGQMSSRIQRPVWQRALRESGLPESQVQEACDRIANSYADWNESTFPGVLGNVVAGRIANRLNLGGTNCVIDAACASSLAGISMAIQELQLGTSDLVIAGGVDALNDPFMYMCFSQTPALSPTGDCRPFSDEADGTMLGEGLGMVALKRLTDAEADGDRIYAVLRGLGSSSDGKSKSVYAPVSSGQAKALRRAYERAGYSPETVELIEAHGTATKAGDAAEIGGLREVFEATDAYKNGAKQWCALGSVKSQIGHTKAAAGSASFLKVVLALHHKVLPPTLKVNRPSPALDIENSPFYLSTQTRPWIRSADHPRRGSVSSFGFGGSNFHVALEEYIDTSAGAGRRADRLRTQPVEMFLFSGATPESVLESLVHVLDATVDREAFLYQSYESVNRFDPAHRIRLALVAGDEQELRSKGAHVRKSLESNPEQGIDLPPGIYYKNATGESQSGRATNSNTQSGSENGVAFLFPGQGSQYVGMGGDLVWNFDSARKIWDGISSSENEALSELPGVVYPRPAFGETEEHSQHERLTATHRAQPAIGLVSLAMMAVLEELGVTAEFFGGHSFGELTALYAAGAYDEAAFLATARKRGELMDAAAESAEAPGAMTAVFHDVESIRSMLSEGDQSVVLANLNTPGQVVIAGSVAGIESIEAKLLKQGIENKRLPVATAFHSKFVSSSTKPFAEFLCQIAFQTPRGKVYSNVNAGPYENGSSEPDGIRARLAEQIASPVRFFEQIEAMYAAGARVFVEVGPSSVLTRLTAEILGDRPHVAVSLDQKKQPGMQSLFHAVARLSVLAGVPTDLSLLWKDYAVPVDPATRAKPKLTVKINGSNYGKPYPPAGGAAALPKPNPERVATNPEPQAVNNMATPQNPLASHAPAPVVSTAQTLSTSSQLSPAPTASVAPAIQAGAPMPAATPAYLSTIQAMQRQTAEAHAAYQRALGDSHQSYLRVAETAFQNLNGMLGNRAVSPVELQNLPSIVSQPIAVPPVSAPPAAIASSQASPVPIASSQTQPAVPASSPEPAPTVTPGLTLADLEQLMMATVAEKTGYPVEMLELDMELEAGLGIDSIKRVQILAAIKQQAPGLGEVDAKHLGTLRTLREIVDYLKENLDPAATSPAVAATASSPAMAGSSAGVTSPALSPADLEQLMMATVAEKTGYPVEMLELDMELEAGLGIDSIKRVQILAAVKQQAPGLGEVDAKHLGTLRTLREIVEYMQAAGASTASNLIASASATVANPVSPASPAANAQSFAELQNLMMATVAEKTGYPVEMLELDMELEAGLGIDSIKRVQILSAIKQQNPNLPEMDPKHLGTLRTLREIIEYLEGPAPQSQAASGENSNGAQALATNASRPAVGRFALRTVSAPAAGLGIAGLTQAKRIVVTEDGQGVAQALVARFAQAGRTAEIVATVPADADAVISLAGLRPTPDEDASIAVNREVFTQARAVAESFSQDTRRGIFVTVQDLGGDFGLASIGQNLDRISAIRGGIAGLAKTAAHEWPQAIVKAIDVAGQGRSPGEIAQVLFAELTAGGLEREVGLLADGSRVVPQSYADELQSADETNSSQANFVDQDSVIVATGGARGVTAHTLIALANAYRPRLALLGRTPLADEAESLRAITDDAALKKALLESAKKRGEKITPADLNREAGRIKANREVRATLAALKAAGSDARYYACDVMNETELNNVLKQIRTEWGPITGLLHGAGVLADKLIAQKTPEQFDHVFNTKVEGLRGLLKGTASDPLKYICLFSSVAARAGNAGQCDYAMANEILNKIANAEAQSRGPGCLVKSMNWGPWEGGMVTPELKQQFEAMGVPLISLDEGAQMLVDEIRRPRLSQVEVVFGGSPVLSVSSEPPVHLCEIDINPAQYDFLNDHAVRGVPVVPVVLVLEWASAAAKSLRPELTVAAIRDVKMLQGLRLTNFADRGVVITLTLRETTDRNRLECLFAGQDGRPHYSCVIEMADAPAQSPAKPEVDIATLAAWPFALNEIYKKHLFHGPRFQVIRSLDGISSDTATAQLESGRKILAADTAGQTDLGMLDGGLQLALLWTIHVLGKENLPTGIREYNVYSSAVTAGRVRCVLRGNADPGRLHTQSDLVFIDENETVLAELRGIEMHVL